MYRWICICTPVASTHAYSTLHVHRRSPAEGHPAVVSPSPITADMADALRLLALYEHARLAAPE